MNGDAKTRAPDVMEVSLSGETLVEETNGVRFFPLFVRHTWVADAHTQRVLKDVVNGKPVEAPVSAKAVDELASVKPAAFDVEKPVDVENSKKSVLETAEVRGASRAMKR